MERGNAVFEEMDTGVQVCVCVCVCVFDCVGVDKKSHSNDSVTSHVASTRENCMVNGNEI